MSSSYVFTRPCGGQNISDNVSFHWFGFRFARSAKMKQRFVDGFVLAGVSKIIP